MRTDVAIVGGGPGGSACAMFLADRGIEAVIIERETFPRYHIGESMTGECGNVVRALGLETEMLKRGFPVKRGVRVYGPRADHEWFVAIKGRSPTGELVDAFTWQVRRSEFDQMLLETAQARGIPVLTGQATKPQQDGGDGARRARASGRRQVRRAGGCLRPVNLPEPCGRDGGPNGGPLPPAGQIAVFSQVTGTIREGGASQRHLLFHQTRDHWAWFIPLDDEVVSVGVVVPGAYLQSRGRASTPSWSESSPS